MRLDEFARSGRVVSLWSDVLEETVVFAGDEADLTGVPPQTVVYRAQELAALVSVTPRHLRSIHSAKRVFGGQVSLD